jgi:CDP-archaeol synthase
MDAIDHKRAAAGVQALPAFLYLALLIWIFVATTQLAVTQSAPIFAHVASAEWAIFPILIGGTLHMALVKDDLFHALARPINQRLFGHSKTWRGVLAMCLFCVVGVYALQMFFGFALASGTFDFNRLTALELGPMLGLSFVLAELPNSWVKRRMGVPPGARAARYTTLFVLGDQLDSVIVCGLIYVLVLGMPWTTFMVLLPVGVLLLLLLKRSLFHLGLKRAPT